MNKFDIIKATANNLSDLIVDATPASLTGSTLDFTELIHPLDSQLQGKHGYVYTGAGYGQERVISKFYTTNNRVEFAQVFSSIPSINSGVVIFNHWAYREYKNAVDRAMGKARHVYLEDKVATMAVTGSQYEYPVPSGFDYISELRLVPSNSTDYGTDGMVEHIFELDNRMFRVDPNAVGTYVIIIDPRRIDMGNFDGHWLNVVGQAKPEPLGSDGVGVPEELEEYLIAYATAHLSSQRLATEGYDHWYRRFKIFKDEKDDLEEYIFRHRHGKGVGR